MSLPILYSFRRCPYAMRARLALQVTQQPVLLREVVLRNKPAEMLEVSPKGTVPVLVLTDGSVIDESIDIMRWTLAQRDPADWLRPGAGSLDEMERLIERTEREFKNHLDRYKYTNRFDGADSEVEREAAAVFLRGLDARLEASAFLFCEMPSLADAAIAPFVRQFANTDRGWFDAQPWEHLRGWLDSFLDAPIFAAIMKKYVQWEVGNAEPQFPLNDERGWSART